MLVAVSGGPDSVACLLILRELGESAGFEVLAAHFDHKLRPDSAADAGFVRELCAGLGVRCLTGEGDVARLAREQKLSIEAAARMMRYQFLAFLAGKEAADILATGHTADDQAETVLMRVVRGSGIRGIRGMMPASNIPGGSAQRLVRPLLALHRADTLAVCREAGVAPLQDPANVSPVHLRNRIRNEVLPGLRKVNPSVDEALLGLAASARDVFAGIERQAMGAQPSARPEHGSVFALAPVATLPAEALTLLVEREAGFFKLAPEVNRTRVENLRQALTAGSGRVRFGEAEVEVSCGQVRIGPPRSVPEPWPTKILDVPGVTIAWPWRIQVSTGDQPAAGGIGVAVAGVARDALHGALRARPLAAGDRMEWRGIVRKVSDLLVNAKVPAWERPGLVAIADGERVQAIIGFDSTPAKGDVLWIRAERRAG